MTRTFFTALALCAAATCLSLPATAAGTATIANNGKAGQFAWLDDDTARFDMPQANGGYMVVRAGKAYMVNPAVGGGMPPVMEISGGLQGMAQAFAADKKNPFGKIDSVKATGKKETVAGVVGEVFDVTITDAQGKTQTREVVLTSDPTVTEMTAAYLGLSSAMLGPEAAKFQDGLPAGKRGLLRSGDDMALQSISAKSPAASAFDLPAEPVNMQDMMKGLMQGMQRMKQ